MLYCQSILFLKSVNFLLNSKLLLLPKCNITRLRSYQDSLASCFTLCKISSATDHQLWTDSRITNL